MCCGLTFQTDQAAFLAGYAAAGMTKTGKVGTFGGIKIPTVTIFMKGFEAGVKYYNQQKGTKRRRCSAGTPPRTMACSPATSTPPMMAASSPSPSMQEGADIIMPVAGPVGLGSAAVCKETGKC